MKAIETLETLSKPQNITAMIIIEHLMTIDDYAKACGVTNRAIYTRYRHRRIAGYMIGAHLIIDPVISPPVKYINSQKGRIKLIPPLPHGINKDDLVAIKDYASEKVIRGYNLFEMAMANKIQSFIIAGIAFAYRSELDKVPSLKKAH